MRRGEGGWLLRLYVVHVQRAALDVFRIVSKDNILGLCLWADLFSLCALRLRTRRYSIPYVLRARSSTSQPCVREKKFGIFPRVLDYPPADKRSEDFHSFIFLCSTSRNERANERTWFGTFLAILPAVHDGGQRCTAVRTYQQQAGHPVPRTHEREKGLKKPKSYSSTLCRPRAGQHRSNNGSLSLSLSFVPLTG